MISWLPLVPCPLLQRLISFCVYNKSSSSLLSFCVACIFCRAFFCRVDLHTLVSDFFYHIYCSTSRMLDTVFAVVFSTPPTLYSSRGSTFALYELESQFRFGGLILGLANTLICDAVISSAPHMSIALARVRSASFSSRLHVWSSNLGKI